jgi:hypothetical protein
MKNSLAVIAGVALMDLAAQSAYADVGAIQANNYGSSAGAITYNGALLPATSDTWVEILAAPAGGTLASVAVGNLTEAGYFDLSGVALNAVAANASANFEVRAWTGAATFDAATIKGQSAVFTQTVGSYNNAATPPGPVTGPDLNVPTFSIGVSVPEPTTIALAMLGAAGLLIRRRK